MDSREAESGARRMAVTCHRAERYEESRAWQHTADALAAERQRAERLEAEVAKLKEQVIAYCGVWAATWARDHGLPEGCIAAQHYDDLEAAGARMVDFTRVEIFKGSPNDA